MPSPLWSLLWSPQVRMTGFSPTCSFARPVLCIMDIIPDGVHHIPGTGRPGSLWTGETTWHRPVLPAPGTLDLVTGKWWSLRRSLDGADLARGFSVNSSNKGPFHWVQVELPLNDGPGPGKPDSDPLAPGWDRSWALRCEWMLLVFCLTSAPPGCEKCPGWCCKLPEGVNCGCFIHTAQHPRPRAI